MNRVMPGSILLCLLALLSCKPKPQPPPQPPPVNLVTATPQRVTYFDKYPGTTQPLMQVNLYPEVQGYITGIFAMDGSHVKKGQKIYEIDRRLFQAAYDQAEANLKVAQNNQVQAQQDADRYVYLNSKNAVAKQLYDHAVIALEVTKNQSQASEQALKTAQTNLNYSVIYAPFDGTVGFSQVRVGNMVTVGQTVLNTISSDDPMAVDFLVNEKQLPFFEKLENNKQAPVDSLFTILMPDNTLYSFTGKISVIDRSVDPQTGAIRVRLVYPNPKYFLRAGMSCTVRVHNLEETPQIVIPGKSVVEQMGEYFVFVVKDTMLTTHADSTQKKEADTAQRGPRLYAFQKKVQLGETLAGNVIVKSGISEGEKIVVDGVQSLHDGSPVATGNKKPSAENGKGGEAAQNSSPESNKKN